MASKSFDRRLGRRVDVVPVQVRWRAPAPDERRRRRLGLRPRPPETAELVEVSVSGAKVRAPLADDLPVGAVLHIGVEGVTGPVRIRRILPYAGSGDGLYGLELIGAASPLIAPLHRLTSRHVRLRASHWATLAGDDV